MIEGAPPADQFTASFPFDLPLSCNSNRVYLLSIWRCREEASTLFNEAYDQRSFLFQRTSSGLNLKPESDAFRATAKVLSFVARVRTSHGFLVSRNLRV
jgi:hypothetical protein